MTDPNRIVQGNVNYVPSAPSETPTPTMADPIKYMGFVPSYDGDSFTIYNYLNSAQQWLIGNSWGKPFQCNVIT